jgi:hypothetical protein
MHPACVCTCVCVVCVCVCVLCVEGGGAEAMAKSAICPCHRNDLHSQAGAAGVLLHLAGTPPPPYAPPPAGRVQAFTSSGLERFSSQLPSNEVLPPGQQRRQPPGSRGRWPSHAERMLAIERCALHEPAEERMCKVTCIMNS